MSIKVAVCGVWSERYFMTVLNYECEDGYPSLEVGDGPVSTFVYVSDFLETLLNASTERALVREVTNSAVSHLPDEIAHQAHYYGGKCMGYPVVWLLKHALDLEEQKLKEVVEACKASIFLSLTTSIVDDWLDKDVEVSVAPVSLMYLLMVVGLGDLNSKHFPSERARQRIHELTEHLLLVEKSASLAHREKLTLCGELVSKAGIKIGHFHELIASEFCNALSVQQSKACELINIANKFGCWCAFVDDVIDVRSDFGNGNWVSLPVLNLAAKLQNDCDENVSLNARTKRLEPLLLDCQSQMIEVACLQLQELGAEAAEMGFSSLSGELLSAEAKLPNYMEAFLENSVRR